MHAETSKRRNATTSKRRIAAELAAYALVIAGLLTVATSPGCAQNLEQPITTRQTTRGSEAPQSVHITVQIAGGHQSQSGDVLTTQPATPAAPTLLASANKPVDLKSDVGKGTASGAPAAGGNVVIAPIWIDSSSLVEAKSGSMSPRTGSIRPTQDGEQKPETQVNPAVPISIGAMPNASASSTSAWKGPATSGPQTFDQSGARNLLKAMGLNDSQAGQFLSWLTGAGATSQPAN